MLVLQKYKKYVGGENKITLEDQIEFSSSKRYAIRRVIKKATSVGDN